MCCIPQVTLLVEPPIAQVLGECLVSACAVIKGLLLPQLVDCLETLFEGVQLMGGSFPAIIHSKVGILRNVCAKQSGLGFCSAFL